MRPDRNVPMAPLQPVQLDRVHTARHRAKEAGPAAPAEDAVLTDAIRHDEEIERVGGRRRFKPEVLLIIGAIVFVVGALIKPWPTPLPAPSASPAALVAAATAQPSAPERPSFYPDIAPWNFRDGGFGPGDTQPPDGTLPDIVGPLSARWSAVDWAVLRGADSHAAWGFGAAVLPDAASAAESPDAFTATAVWVASDTPPASATLAVQRGHQAFGLALTWPAGVVVTDVRFTYLGGPEHPPYLPPPGFPAFALVSPLPASAVSTPPGVAAESPGSSPGPTSARRAPSSGQYWIPPSEASYTAVTGSLPTAWKSFPWPWPNGTYRVTITTRTGSLTTLLHLQAA
jgi:hypothetical protein